MSAINIKLAIKQTRINSFHEFIGLNIYRTPLKVIE